MTIPDFQSILLPFLQYASDGKIHTIGEARTHLGRLFNLTDRELSEMIDSGQHRFDNRVGWARTHLKKAGLIQSPQRGHFQITKRGLDTLKRNPQKIDMSLLGQFPEYHEFRKKTNADRNVGANEISDELTPEETIENAYLKMKSSLTDELLDYVTRSSPEFFEKLVVQLLVAMGYGGSQKEAA